MEWANNILSRRHEVLFCASQGQRHENILRKTSQRILHSQRRIDYSMSDNMLPRQLDTFFLKVFQYLPDLIEKGTASDKEKMLFMMLEGVLTYNGDGTPVWDREKLKAFELELPEDVVDLEKIFGKTR